MVCSKIVFNLNQRDITRKLSKTEQPFLYETCCLNLIYIAIKFHYDIPKPYIVTESNRAALQTVIVYFLQRAVTPLKIIGV